MFLGSINGRPFSSVECFNTRICFSVKVLQPSSAGSVSKPSRPGREANQMFPELHPEVVHGRERSSANHFAMSRRNGEMCRRDRRNRGATLLTRPCGRWWGV